MLLSTRGLDGLCDILSFMTGDEVFTHTLPRFISECEPYLKNQFPQLFTPEMDFARAELREMLKTPSGKKDPEKLVLGWLSKLTSGKYGFKCPEALTVKRIPKTAHQVKHPFQEAAEMRGRQRKSNSRHQ
jgi:hypothetical protein